MQETTTPRRFPAKRTTLIAGALAVPAIVAGVFVAGSANASSNPAPTNTPGQTLTAIAPLAKDSGVTVTAPDGTKHAASSSGWVSVGPDGKIQQGTGTPPFATGKGQSFTATAQASEGSGATITYPDGTKHAAPSSGWVSVGPDGKVTQSK